MVRNELVEGVPEGCPVYTRAELEELSQGNVSKETLRLVHEAKRLAGAKVIGAGKPASLSKSKDKPDLGSGENRQPSRSEQDVGSR